MPNLMSQAEYARYKSVAKSTVTRWVAAGRIKLDENGRIDVDAAEASLGITANPDPAASARAVGVGSGGGQDLDSAREKIELRMKMARMKKAEHEAQQTALDLDERAGHLVKKTDHDFVVADLIATIDNTLRIELDRVELALVSATEGHAVRSISSDLAATVQEMVSDHYARKSREIFTGGSDND